MTAAQEDQQARQQQRQKQPASTLSTLVSKTTSVLPQQLTQSDSIYPTSAVVGVVAAAVGFLYVNILSRCRQLLWKTLPNHLWTLRWLGDGHHAAFFIVTMTTLGGLLLGIISTTHTAKKATYTASEFVSICSEKYYNTQQQEQEVAVVAQTIVENEDDGSLLPSAKTHLLPLLGMCLLTSSFGIPLGPEA